MIQVQELRVGNLAQISNESRVKKRFIFDKVFIITSHDISQIGRGGYPLEPIPLTEEWLLKFGFVSNPYQDRYEFNSLHIECNKTKGYLELWIEDLPHIKYVHQLQNLCYLMFNEELTINQP